MSETIVLTGAGGDIGIAAARCLRESHPEAVLVGADCRTDTPAAAIFDCSEVLPRADDARFPGALEALITATGASLLLPLSEAELATLVRDNRAGGEIAGARVVCANPDVISMGLDKHATNRRLAELGCPVPQSGVVGEDRPEVFPVVVKPRRGQGSKGVEIVDHSRYHDLVEDRRGDVWQRFLAEADEEFTCGIARFPGVATRVISFRRQLAGGLTGKGVVVDDPRLDKLGRRIAEGVDLRGAINMQLRMDRGVPTIFEINPRLSSTVRFRHLLGFRDLVWSIEDALGEPVSGYVPPVPGTQIYRIAEELIIPPT